MKFTVVSHACMYIEGDGGSVLIDPWIRLGAIANEDGAHLDAEARAQLRALGYIED